MGNCDAKLAGKFARQCGHRPKQGIQKKWYLNWNDIDRAATHLDKRGTVVTQLTLKENAYLYPAEGNPKIHKASHSLSVLEFGNGYIHTDTYTITYRGADERERIQELVDGAKVCTIIQKTDGGVNGELTFEIVGFESGMVVTEDNWSSAENSGATTLTVSTLEGEEETTGIKLLQIEDVEDWIRGYEYTDA